MLLLLLLPVTHGCFLQVGACPDDEIPFSRELLWHQLSVLIDFIQVFLKSPPHEFNTSCIETRLLWLYKVSKRGRCNVCCSSML